MNRIDLRLLSLTESEYMKQQQQPHNPVERYRIVCIQIVPDEWEWLDIK